MQIDLANASRREIEDMIRRRRNLGAALSVLGMIGLWAMVYLIVPEDSGPAPIAATATTLQR